MLEAYKLHINICVPGCTQIKSIDIRATKQTTAQVNCSVTQHCFVSA